jgi:hypothetical protein
MAFNYDNLSNSGTGYAQGFDVFYEITAPSKTQTFENIPPLHR